jgi:SPP1 family predicted phage head-tail adaptor
MRAGNLSRRITIQTLTETNTYGDVVKSWTDERTVWCEIVTTGGGEFYAAQKLNAETTVLFKTRYFRGLTTKHRIKYCGRVYEILSVNDVGERRRELHISAKEVV